MGQIHLPKFKKKAEKTQGIIVFGDEASFRQTPTLHQTWAFRNSQPQVPSHGQRNTQKVLGAISPMGSSFNFKMQKEYFKWDNYIIFLEGWVLPFFYKRNRKVYFIQDNASYHTKPEVQNWANDNSKFIELIGLPKYSPELNAAEKIWKHTRKECTHNKFFDTPELLIEALDRTFVKLQNDPQRIFNLTKSFF
jgi:transposase